MRASASGGFANTPSAPADLAPASPALSADPLTTAAFTGRLAVPAPQEGRPQTVRQVRVQHDVGRARVE